MVLTPTERDIIKRRAEQPVRQDGWQAQYACDIPQLLDALAEAERRLGHANPGALHRLRQENRDLVAQVSALEAGEQAAARLAEEKDAQYAEQAAEWKIRVAQGDEERARMASVRTALERALAEAERHTDPTTEGWRLEAIRLRESVIEVETERRELQARIAQDDEERSVMTSVRAALERVLADVRDDLADRTGLLSWIAEQLGSRCIKDIRTDLPELFMARDEAVRQRDHARAELDEARRQSDGDARDALATISRLFSGGGADGVVGAVRACIAQRDEAISARDAARTDASRARAARDEARLCRDEAYEQLRSVESRSAEQAQRIAAAERDLRRIRDLLVTQGDTLHRIGKALGVEVVTLQSVEDAARMSRNRVTELDARLADAAEQADTYKGLADRLGDFIKEISAALHVEPGDEILGTAKAMHAELEERRAIRPGPLLRAASAGLAADEEVFCRLGALLDCPASVGHITEAIRRLVIAHRRALQDVSDRDRWLAESSVVTTRLQAKLAKIREAADLD